MSKKIFIKTTLRLLLSTTFVIVVNRCSCNTIRKGTDNEPVELTSAAKIEELQAKVAKLKEDLKKEEALIEGELKKVGLCPDDISLKEYIIDKGAGVTLAYAVNDTEAVRYALEVDATCSVAQKFGIPYGGMGHLKGLKTLLIGKVESSSAIADFLAKNLTDDYPTYIITITAATNINARACLAIIIGTIDFMKTHRKEVYDKVKDADLTKNKEALKYVESLSDDFEVTKYKGDYTSTPKKWIADGTIKISMKEYKQKAKPAIEAIIKHKEKMILIDADIKKINEEIEKLKKDEKNGEK